MFDYLKGKLASKQIQSYRGSHAVIDVNGVGYLIQTGSRTISALPETGQDVKMYLSLIHKEDTMQLSGFLTKEERDIFNILQSVSGVGLKMALLLLDEFTVSELLTVVINEDFKELSRTKGVGPKMAQKIILELKDKLINWSNITPIDVSDVGIKSDVPPDCISEAQSVLLSLGYSQNEAQESIKQVLCSSNTPKDSEEVLRYALEYLAKIQ